MRDERHPPEQRTADRRVRRDPAFAGPDRRKGDRRKVPRQPT